LAPASADALPADSATGDSGAADPSPTDSGLASSWEASGTAFDCCSAWPRTRQPLLRSWRPARRRGGPRAACGPRGRGVRGRSGRARRPAPPISPRGGKARARAPGSVVPLARRAGDGPTARGPTWAGTRSWLRGP
jgi:hypothetical protein